VERLTGEAENIKEKVLGKVIEWVVENIDHIEELFTLDFPLEYLDQAAELVAQGCRIMLVANHQSHADVFPLALATSALTERVNLALTRVATMDNSFYGFIGPKAASVETGGQGSLIAGFFDQIEPWLLEHMLDLVSIVRGKYEKDESRTLKDLAVMTRKVRSGRYGLAILPEGTVEGGRLARRVPSRRHGIVESKPGLMSTLILKSLNRGKDVVVVPLGLDGGYRVFSPNYKLPSVITVGALGKNIAGGSPLSVAKAVMGEPFLASSLNLPAEQTDITSMHMEVNRQVMGMVSTLLPDRARGVFR
jgi:1-acyl-sn-glycerol-3-phosphate acyltransferase